MYKRHSHSADHRSCDQGLDASNNAEDYRRDPDKSPVLPLDHHGVHGSDEMDSDDIDERPE